MYPEHPWLFQSRLRAVVQTHKMIHVFITATVVVFAGRCVVLNEKSQLCILCPSITASLGICFKEEGHTADHDATSPFSDYLHQEMPSRYRQADLPAADISHQSSQNIQRHTVIL